MEIGIVDGRLAAWTGFAARELMKAIPGARWNAAERCWTYPLAWPSALALGVAAGRLREAVAPRPEAVEWVAAEGAAWGALTTEAARILADEEGVEGFFPHQVQCAKWLAMPGAKGGRLDISETGCLTGDTMLTVNRGGKGSQIRLDDLVHRFNGGHTGGFGHGAQWDPAIPTRVSYRAEDGSVRSGQIKAAWVSGEKEVFEIVTTSGHRIKASATHPFLTADGWETVDTLSVGTEVYVNIGQGGRAHKAKPRYRVMCVPEGSHPYARRSTNVFGKRVQYRVDAHRLAADAAINGMDLEEFHAALWAGEAGFDFIDPRVHVVHHRDGNHLNNDPQNLQLMTPDEHHKHHASPESVLYRTELSVITSITPCGVEMTYDIEMAEEPHNYIANGFVVHNSGKTRAALRAAWTCWSQGERGILLVSTLMAVKYGWRTEVAAVSGLLPLPEGAEWQVFTLDNAASADKRRKTIAQAAAASEAAGGVGVVLLTNHEQLRTHSRLSGYGDIALRRCPVCGGVKEGDEVVTEAKCQAHDKELNKLEYVAVVWDEIHRMMNPAAQTTRAVWAIGEGSPRVWGLTGTPGSRSVMENTWALLRAVYGSDWPSKSSWTQYFAECGPSSLGFWEIGRLRSEREPEFRAEYAALSRRILKAQVLDLPPLLRGGTLERYVTMKGEQLDVYRQMRDRLWLKVEEGEVTAANVLVQIGRLAMLANATGVPGPDYGKLLRYEKDKNGDMVPVYDAQMKLRMPSNKVDAVVDMATGGDFEGSSVVFQFVHPDLIGMLRDAFIEKKVIQRADQFGIIAGGVSEAQRALAIERFQGRKIPFIAFTTAAGGAGITLTAADTMVAVERPWSSIQWKQAQDRVHRIGSEIHEKVSVIDIITENSVELGQLERFRENADALEEVVRDMSRMKELLFG